MTKKLFSTLGTAKYDQLSANHAHMRGYTIAAFIATGMLSLPKAGPRALKSGDAKRWGKIVGSAKGYWSTDRVKKGALTDAGLQAIAKSLKGEARGYSTTREIVAAFQKGITTGEPVTVGGVTYKMVPLKED